MGSKALRVPRLGWHRDPGSLPPAPSLCVPPHKLSCPPPQRTTGRAVSIVTFWKYWVKRNLFAGQKEQEEVRALHEKRRMGRDFPERGVINHHKLCSAKPESSSPTAACRPGGGPALISRIALRLWAGRICWGLRPAWHRVCKWL